MSDEVMVTMNDVRQAHMCSRGCREFCARYNIEWSEFLRVGVSSTRLEEIGDAMALKAVVVARERLAPKVEPERYVRKRKAFDPNDPNALRKAAEPEEPLEGDL